METNARKLALRTKIAPRADQLRPLNLPQLVTVELDDDGLPLTITGSCPSTTHREQGSVSTDNVMRKAVESVIEVWHVDDEWWRDPISRRYVEVILEGGKHVVFYEDSNTNDWFMQMP